MRFGSDAGLSVSTNGVDSKPSADVSSVLVRPAGPAFPLQNSVLGGPLPACALRGLGLRISRHLGRRLHLQNGGYRLIEGKRDMDGVTRLWHESEMAVLRLLV